MTKKRIPELKVELVEERCNLLYLALLEYKNETYLCVINNIENKKIGAYVLDYAEQENVSVPDFLSAVTRWFYKCSDCCPLSIELAKNGLTESSCPIYRSFDSVYVSRIVGNAFKFDGLSKNKVKRRRIIPLPEGIPIKLKKSVF